MNGWDWRIGDRISPIGSDRFHAYDGDDSMACRPSCGLVATVKEPDEGSDLCPECMGIVQAGPPKHPAKRAEVMPPIWPSQSAAPQGSSGTEGDES